MGEYLHLWLNIKHSSHTEGKEASTEERDFIVALKLIEPNVITLNYSFVSEYYMLELWWQQDILQIFLKSCMSKYEYTSGLIVYIPQWRKIRNDKDFQVIVIDWIVFP